MFLSRSISTTIGSEKPKVVSNKYSIEFDGVDDYLDTKYTYDFYNSGDTKPYTIAAWVKLIDSPHATNDDQDGAIFSDKGWQCTWSYVYRYNAGSPDIRITNSAGGIDEAGFGRGI